VYSYAATNVWEALKREEIKAANHNQTNSSEVSQYRAIVTSNFFSPECIPKPATIPTGGNCFTVFPTVDSEAG